ncbi:hypothetical protein P9112_006861 [Eukaryota sp. TZLM1-RC]
MEFTDAQLAEFQEAFALFDREKSGKLKGEDVVVVMRSLGANVTDSEVNRMVEERDPDTKSVTFDDLVEMLGQAKSLSNFDEEIVKAFAVLDRDNSGFVPAKEIRTVLTNVGEKLTNEEVDELFAFSDVDDEALISFDMFKRMVSFSV